MLLREQVLLAVPLKAICREDCKGLCPHCGKNLNLDAMLLRGAGGRSALVGVERDSQQVGKLKQALSHQHLSIQRLDVD